METQSLVKEDEFSSLFTFIYSPREGTPAAAMDDTVSWEEKGKWISELLLVQEEIAERNIQKHIGNTYKVLCDSVGSKDGYMSGHNSGTASIEFKGDESMLGKFVTVKVNSYDGVLLGTAELIKREEFLQ